MLQGRKLVPRSQWRESTHPHAVHHQGSTAFVDRTSFRRPMAQAFSARDIKPPSSSDHVVPACVFCLSAGERSSSASSPSSPRTSPRLVASVTPADLQGRVVMHACLSAWTFARRLLLWRSLLARWRCPRRCPHLLAFHSIRAFNHIYVSERSLERAALNRL